jgi:colanic acid biosynthesis glycosyl transferase WcaI
MPGTMTRFARVRNSGGSTQPRAHDDAPAGALAGRHLALIGTDTSPHVTGFPGFTGSVRRILEERSGRVSRPLQEPLVGVPDLVVAVLPGPGAAAAAVDVANRHGAPLLVLVQGETRPPEDEACTPGARLAARLEGTALARADRWGVLGEATHQRLRRLGVPAARIERLPYWAEARAGGSAGSLAGGSAGGLAGGEVAERGAARRRLGWGGGFLVVCPIGSDTSGVPALLDAAGVLAGRASDIRFVLLGRGPRLHALRAATDLAPNVVLADPGDDDYSRALSAADLVLVTEGSDVVDAAAAGRLAAGLAAGRPVLAAVDPEGHLTGELRLAAGAVVTVAPNRPLDLADTLDRLRDAPQARAVLAAGARHYARACLGPTPAARALAAVAGRTLQSRGAHRGGTDEGPGGAPFSWWRCDR